MIRLSNMLPSSSSILLFFLFTIVYSTMASHFNVRGLRSDTFHNRLKNARSRQHYGMRPNDDDGIPNFEGKVIDINTIIDDRNDSVVKSNESTDGQHRFFANLIKTTFKEVGKIIQGRQEEIDNDDEQDVDIHSGSSEDDDFLPDELMKKVMSVGKIIQGRQEEIDNDDEQDVDIHSGSSEDDDFLPDELVKKIMSVDDRSESDEIIVKNSTDDDEDEDISSSSSSDDADVIDGSEEEEDDEDDDKNVENFRWNNLPLSAQYIFGHKRHLPLSAAASLKPATAINTRPTAVMKICNEFDVRLKCECYDDRKIGIIDCAGEALTSAHVQPIVITAGSGDFKAHRILLNDNRIRELKKNQIVRNHVGSVQYLDLSDNAIANIEDGAFNGMLVLKSLLLTGNRLQHITQRVFADSAGLQLSLTTLLLNKNRINFIAEGAFAALAHIETIVLDDNRDLTLTSHTFGPMHSLVELSLQRCGLASLPTGIFSELRNLRSLSLAGNPLFAVSPVVNAIHSLQFLDISSTALHHISTRMFDGMTNLRQLNVGNMRELVAIDNCAMCGLMALKSISMRNSTALVDVHVNAFGHETNAIDSAGQLTSIDFAGCQLHHVDANLYAWSKLDDIRFDRNPLHCDAQIYWMSIEYRKMHSIRSTNPIPRCASPSHLIGLPIDELKATDLIHLSTFAVGILASIVLTAIAIALICIVACCTWTVVDQRRRIGRRFEQPKMPYEQFRLIIDQYGIAGYNNYAANIDDERKMPMPPAVEV